MWEEIKAAKLKENEQLELYRHQGGDKEVITEEEPARISHDGTRDETSSAPSQIEIESEAKWSVVE